MKNVKIISNHVQQYIKALGYCLKISWDASKYYTVLRFICGIVFPILGILNAFLGKYLINLFTGSFIVENKYNISLILFICIFFVSIMQRSGNTLEQYLQSMHDSILSEKLAVMIMDCSVKSDLENFDNTEYYDKLQAASRDSFSIIQIIWNALLFLSAAVSFIGVFCLLWAENSVYGILLTVAAIPYTVVSTGYTKSLYYLSMEQINAERKAIFKESRWIKDIHKKYVFIKLENF